MPFTTVRSHRHDHQLAGANEATRHQTDGAGAAGRDGRRQPVAEDRLPRHSLLLVATLAAAAANQGAYYGAGQVLVAGLLAAGLVTALIARPWSRHDIRFAPVWPAVGLAGWATMRAVVADDASAALPTVGLLAGVVAVWAIARRTRDVGALASAALAVGALVALTGWAGVAWRISPWARPDQGLWRAATSLTYANAAAALLAMLALLSLGRLVGRAASPLAVVTTSLLFLGVGATLSRGGMLAMAAGGVALAIMLGVGAVLRAALAPAIGALVALVGLLPSMPEASPSPRPLLAAVALLVGMAAATTLAAASADRRRSRMLLGLMAVAVPLALVAGAQSAGSLRAVADSRLTASSPDRAEALLAGVRLVREHPVAGVGPGRGALSWVGPDGRTLVAKYAHNEYLQVSVELGLVGLALLLAMFAGVAAALLRSSTAGSTRPLWAGGVAALVALAVGSAFDFLWHVPAVPLFGALLIGATASHNRKEQQWPNEEVHRCASPAR